MVDADDDLVSKIRVLELHAARARAGAAENTDPLSQPAAPALQKLQAVTISDLKVGKHHAGCALYGSLCAEAILKNRGVHTVLEDVAGRAVLLSIYNVAISTTSGACLKQRFPTGMKLVIKEPLLRKEKGGILVLRVDNLLNMEKVLALPDLNGCLPPRFAANETPISLRLEGNRLFSSKDWLGAAEAYTKCIELASSAGDSTIGAAALSNRAEVWIKVGNFEQALADSNNALKIDASNVKSLCRKARALHGLHEYELSLAWMKNAAEAMSRENMNNMNINSLIQQCETSLRQTKSGAFDIGGFLIGSRIRERAPPCADFVGNVAIRCTPGAGRGLFATERVKAGDLLLVSNALAVAYADSTSINNNYSNLQDDLVTKLMAAVVSSKRGAQQITALLSGSKKVPSLDLFRPNAKWYSESFELGNNEVRMDPDAVRRVVKENSFGQFLSHKLDCMFNNADVVMNPRSCGLWVLPSFINHSCQPNAARLEVGRAMFVHAAKDIMVDEEILLPYFDVLAPIHIRQEICQQRWDFQCQCRRCCFERSQHKCLKKINDQYNSLHEKAFKEINSAAEAGEEALKRTLPACANFAQLAIKIQTDPQLHNLPMIRASYGAAYLSGFASPEFFEDSMTKIPAADEIVKAFHDTVPGHWRTLIHQSVELMKLREYVNPDNWQDGIIAETRDIAYEFCRSTFGNQRPEVYDALIQQAAKLRPF